MNLIIDLSKVSLYRTQLMGIAAILIVLCHASLYGVQMCSVLSTILNIGNIGVDVFLFLSGMGCYYSLNKPKSGGCCHGINDDFFEFLYHILYHKYHFGAFT